MLIYCSEERFPYITMSHTGSPWVSLNPNPEPESWRQHGGAKIPLKHCLTPEQEKPQTLVHRSHPWFSCVRPGAADVGRPQPSFLLCLVCKLRAEEDTCTGMFVLKAQWGYGRTMRELTLKAVRAGEEVPLTAGWHQAKTVGTFNKGRGAFSSPSPDPCSEPHVAVWWRWFWQSRTLIKTEINRQTEEKLGGIFKLPLECFSHFHLRIRTTDKNTETNTRACVWEINESAVSGAGAEPGPNADHTAERIQFNTLV